MGLVVSLLWGATLAAGWAALLGLGSVLFFVPQLVTSLGATGAAWAAGRWVGKRNIPPLWVLPVGMALPILSVGPGLLLQVILAGAGCWICASYSTARSTMSEFLVYASIPAWAAACFVPVVCGVTAQLATVPLLGVLAATKGTDRLDEETMAPADRE